MGMSDKTHKSDKGRKMFPTSQSTIYRNEEGEILGWDNSSYYDEPDYNPESDYWDGDDDSDDDDDSDESDESDESDDPEQNEDSYLNDTWDDSHNSVEPY